MAKIIKIVLIIIVNIVFTIVVWLKLFILLTNNARGGTSNYSKISYNLII